MDHLLSREDGVQSTIKLARPNAQVLRLLLQGDLDTGDLADLSDPGPLPADDCSTSFRSQHHGDRKPSGVLVAFRNISLAQLVVQNPLSTLSCLQGAHYDNSSRCGCVGDGRNALWAGSHAHFAPSLLGCLLDSGSTPSQHHPGHTVGDHQVQADLVGGGGNPAQVAFAGTSKRVTPIRIGVGTWIDASLAVAAAGSIASFHVSSAAAASAAAATSASRTTTTSRGSADPANGAAAVAWHGRCHYDGGHGLDGAGQRTV
mmetsp:Transcript_26199/g.56826  ORF Transcript_26199/g.56826 Transcript_26199/m.56826 type:complete len:259 (+) Transcript_26199:2056-2832(+)